MIKGIRDIVSENIEYLPKIARYGLLSIKKQNKGSDLGYLWIWLKPLMYVGMFYIALAFGIKNAKDIPGMVCPYIIWLASGLYPWFFMQSYAIGNAKVYLKYKMFIKKQNFPVSVIPMIPISTGFFIHLSLILLLLIMALLFGVKPSLTWLQIPIYTAAMMYFAYIWVLLTGLLTALTEDFSNVINSIKPAFFWLSGIFFNSRGRATAQIFFYLNPITFPVEGYRNCVAYNMWFWEEPGRLKGYLLTMLVLTILAVLLYRRVRRQLPEFI
ncbi:MAG: hypothetical protein J6Q41_05820 [Firmicutes bacterium]|nr:hypothetical protein [Bacillota bacterium]